MIQIQNITPNDFLDMMPLFNGEGTNIGSQYENEQAIKPLYSTIKLDNDQSQITNNNENCEIDKVMYKGKVAIL